MLWPLVWAPKAGMIILRWSATKHFPCTECPRCTMRAPVIFDFKMGNGIMKSVAEQDQTSRQCGGENLFKFGEDGEGTKWRHMRTA
jgi:hypothetical protein